MSFAYCVIKHFLGPVYTDRQTQKLQQLCNDASDTVLIESNGVTPDWSCNPFLVTPLSSMRTVQLLTLTLGINGPLARNPL